MFQKVLSSFILSFISLMFVIVKSDVLFCVHKNIETTYVVIKLNVKIVTFQNVILIHTNTKKKLCLPLSNSFGEENGEEKLILEHI